MNEVIAMKESSWEKDVSNKTKVEHEKMKCSDSRNGNAEGKCSRNILECLDCKDTEMRDYWADPVGSDAEEQGGSGMVADLEEEEVVGDQAEDRELEEGQEEARDPLRRRPAARPTQEEVRLHRATHLPFREWCPECVAGAANDFPHRRQGKSSEQLPVPEVHVDYCFPRDSVGGDYVVVLVARDRETKMTVAHVVPVKGADQEWVAEQLVRDMLKFGHHGDLILKSDQEPAVVDLLREVARLRGTKRTILENSPVGDSKANGMIERGIQSVEKILRVHKLALESRIGTKLPVKHALFTWLVEHAADVLNRFAVGADGKTAVQRLKGKSCEKYVLEFGAAAMFRVCGKVEGSLMTERWFSGVWLGKRLGTEEHVVMKEDGSVVRARAVRYMEKAMTMNDYDVLTGRPHDPLGTLHAGGQRNGARRVDPARGGGEPSVEDRAAPKRVMITRDIVARYGATAGCKKCRGLVTGDRAYQHVHHSEDCRKRLEDMMRNDEAYREQVERAEFRRTERLAEVLERRMKAQDRQARLDEETARKKRKVVHQTEGEKDPSPGGIASKSYPISVCETDGGEQLFDDDDSYGKPAALDRQTSGSGWRW